jgi:hypothetical protein
MPAPTTYADGKVSKLTVGSTTYYLTSFKFGQKYDKHDVTMSPNTGKKTYQLGLSEVPFSGDGFLDLTYSPFTALQNGSLVSIVWCADGTDANFTSEYCVIDDVEWTAPVNNIITVSFTGSAGPDYATS